MDEEGNTAVRIQRAMGYNRREERQVSSMDKSSERDCGCGTWWKPACSKGFKDYRPEGNDEDASTPHESHVQKKYSPLYILNNRNPRSDISGRNVPPSPYL
jgi:hypothetical protein